MPTFFDTVANRIWQEWWQLNGHPLEYIATRPRENMDAAPIPFALVAHDGERFLGTSSVIASDLEERPQLTPWVAAVWVEEEARRHGVGAALVNRAAQECFALGIPQVYLCARPPCCVVTDSGWIIIEAIGPSQTFFQRTAAPIADEDRKLFCTSRLKRRPAEGSLHRKQKDADRADC